MGDLNNIQKICLIVLIVSMLIFGLTTFQGFFADTYHETGQISDLFMINKIRLTVVGHDASAMMYNVPGLISLATMLGSALGFFLFKDK